MMPLNMSFKVVSPFINMTTHRTSVPFAMMNSFNVESHTLFGGEDLAAFVALELSSPVDGPDVSIQVVHCLVILVAVLKWAFERLFCYIGGRKVEFDFG